jgi:penicillin G amidase
LSERATSDRAKTEDVLLPGLNGEAEIIVDQWGIPHIYAGSERDAFFLQGWNAARDRLWQIDLWRKRGLGRLSASFGPAYLEQDIALRAFLYRGDMDAEWKAYGEASKRLTEAFVEGVNAYTDNVRRNPNLLPVEFELTGSQPEDWCAEDVVRIRSHGLTRNLASEVARARVVCACGLEADSLRKKLEPPISTCVPEGLDPCSIPADVLRMYILATQRVEFSRSKTSVSLDNPTDYQARSADMEERSASYGSNSWTIAPFRTTTGRPILANDPHRDIDMPSLRYITHLSAPGFDVIGAGEPALPGISIGHNGTIAFGLTIFRTDQEDLYVYDLHPDNHDLYKYKDGYETVRTVTEEIKVKGEKARREELKFTRHGPIIYIDERKHRAFAVRSTWFEPGASAYFGSTKYLKAKSFQEFKDAMETWGSPSENQVYADVEGNIGWLVGGHAPVRPNWDGLMPVPGDGRYEWAGMWSGHELPFSYNPTSGYVATANEMNIPLDGPAISLGLGFEWNNPSRIKRIKEVLDGKAALSLRDSMELQTDETSQIARRIVGLLSALESEHPLISLGLKLLAGWDGRTSVDSAAAAVAEVWISKHLAFGVVNAVTPLPAQAIVGAGDLDAIADLLDQPDDRFGADPSASRNRILLETLGAAVGEMSALLGPDHEKWAWGKLHHMQFDHSLSDLADEGTKAQLNVARLQIGGSPFSPMATNYRMSDFRTIDGASFRVVIDVGSWDESVVINTPGQSGNPESPFYRNLFPFWAAGDYVPLLYSRSAVEAAAFHRYRLKPQ